jgi:hypothetical protein
MPINVYNREWRTIAGPWLQGGYNASAGSCNEYTQAPRTAHIAWDIPPVSGEGGYIGAYEENIGITTSNIYTSSYASIACVMAGRGYYAANGYINCVDMQTGETLWKAPGTGMSKFGLPAFVAGATRSRAPVLYTFGNQFVIYDALTGAVQLNVTGLPMLMFDDPYVISVVGTNMICWTTAGTSADFSTRVIWNVTDPYLAFPYSPATWPWNYVIANGLIVYGLQKYGRGTYEGAVMEGMVARNETTGELVYAVSDLDVTNPDTWLIQQGPARGAGYGLYYYPITGDPAQVSTSNPNDLTTGGYVAFNVSTGNIAWKSAPYHDGYPWGCFFCYNPEACGYGMIFGLGYAGIYAINATNGDIVWHYTAGNSGEETPYNTWPFGSVGSVVGGGILFAPNTEHSPTLYYRGNTLKAIDVYSGEEVWDIMGYYTPTAIAYGTLMASDTTSGYTYAFAKGETATTVVTQNDVYAKGSTILIKGTVLDQSPAQPNTPAISDDSMTAWMEYLHMQQPKPTNATGVSVTLTATDSNGQSTTIGTVTSDANGNYAYAWTPQTEGTYMIMASFCGSEAYYASYAETAVAIAPASGTSTSASPSVPTTSEPSTSTSPSAPSTTASVAPEVSPTQAPPSNEPLPANIYIAIVAAVIIIAVVAAAILLRKRKK